MNLVLGLVLQTNKFQFQILIQKTKPGSNVVMGNFDWN